MVHVYIMTNEDNKIFYPGVTSQLETKIWEHKIKFYPQSFTAKNNCNKLVWYQTYQTVEEATEKEKEIKNFSSKEKEALIESINPKWEDLWHQIQDI